MNHQRCLPPHPPEPLGRAESGLFHLNVEAASVAHAAQVSLAPVLGLVPELKGNLHLAGALRPASKFEATTAGAANNQQRH